MIPMNTVERGRNEAFMGRENELNCVYEMLSRQAQGEPSDSKSKKGGPAQGATAGLASCILYGSAGIGKTQIALEYVYRYQREYHDIFWLAAEHDWTLTSSCAKIVDTLHLLDGRTRTAENDERQNLARDEVREWLANITSNWLLVFDNVEDIDDLRHYIPPKIAGHGSIIITSRKPFHPSFAKTHDAIHVKPLGREDAAKLLFKYIRRDPHDENEKETSRVLADMCDGLPLAIAMSGGYINQRGDKLQNYKETLQNLSIAWRKSAGSPANQHEKIIETIFNISVGELSKNARCFISILAFLDPDRIPEAFFVEAIKANAVTFPKDEDDMVNSIIELHRRQLIRYDVTSGEPCYTIHRAIQWNTLLYLSKDSRHRWQALQQSFSIIYNMLAKNEYSPVPSLPTMNWPILQQCGLHILSLKAHCLWANPPVELPVNFAEVSAKLSPYSWVAGRLVKEGEAALESISDMVERSQGNNQYLIRAAALQVLSITSSLDGVSKRKKSMNLRTKDVQAHRLAYNATPQVKITPGDQVRVSLAETLLAYGLVQEENFEAADEIMGRVCRKYRHCGPEEKYPYLFCQYYQIRGVCQMASGKPTESMKCITRCAELLAQSRNIMHPMAQLLQFITGFLTWHAGEPEKALEIHESVLEAQLKVIGEFSHLTMESYSTCGRLLAEQGDLNKARVYLERCLDWRKRAAWNEEGVARAQFRYAHVLERLGETAEAQKQGAMAGETRERFMKEYPQYLPPMDDEEAVFDQMVSIWSGRFTGKMKQKPSSNRRAGTK